VFCLLCVRLLHLLAALTEFVHVLTARAGVVLCAIAVLLLCYLVALARVRIAARALIWIERLLLVALVAPACIAGVLTVGADADALVYLCAALCTEPTLALCCWLHTGNANAVAADAVRPSAQTDAAVAEVLLYCSDAEAVGDRFVTVVAGISRRWLTSCRHLERKEGNLGRPGALGEGGGEGWRSLLLLPHPKTHQ
jgi:hypothetical protein